MPTVLPIAKARERSGLSVDELAEVIGINASWCWDLMVHEGELTSNLSLRQVLRAASALHVSPLSLLPGPIASAPERRTFDELTLRITRYCADHGIRVDQFGERAGWDVQSVLCNPAAALDEWCLECLQDVSATVGLPWQDFLHDQHLSIRPDTNLTSPAAFIPDAMNAP